MTKCDIFKSPRDQGSAVARLKKNLDAVGQPVADVVKCSSMAAASDGIQEICSLLRACSDRGWSAEGEWEEEKHIIPQLPDNTTYQQQRRQGRTLRNSRQREDGRMMRGGKGGK